MSNCFKVNNKRSSTKCNLNLFPDNTQSKYSKSMEETMFSVYESRTVNSNPTRISPSNKIRKKYKNVLNGSIMKKRKKRHKSKKQKKNQTTILDISSIEETFHCFPMIPSFNKLALHEKLLINPYMKKIKNNKLLTKSTVQFPHISQTPTAGQQSKVSSRLSEKSWKGEIMVELSKSLTRVPKHRENIFLESPKETKPAELPLITNDSYLKLLGEKAKCSSIGKQYGIDAYYKINPEFILQIDKITPKDRFVEIINLDFPDLKESKLSSTSKSLGRMRLEHTEFGIFNN